MSQKANDRPIFSMLVPFLPVIVFAVALAMRLLQNVALLRFCVCDYGDAHNLLIGGCNLLGGRLAFPDGARLEGWPYMLLLGLAARAFGVNMEAPSFAQYCQPFAILNSLLDSVTCLLIFLSGRRYFGRAVALTAAILWAFYPPAVLAARICDGQTFAAFTVAAWIYLAFKTLEMDRAGRRIYLLNWLGLGIVTALLLMSKLVLVLIPFAVACALAVFHLLARCPARRSAPAESETPSAEGKLPAETLVGATVRGKTKRQAQWAGAQTEKHMARWSGESASERSSVLPSPVKRVSGRLVWQGLVIALTGFCLMVVPVLCLSQVTSGGLATTLHRLCMTRIFIGNNTSMDGWRINAQALPATDQIPGLLAKAVLEEPERFVAMEFGKVSRLWLTAWNPLQMPVLVLHPEQQEIIQELLVFFALISLALMAGGNGRLTSDRFLPEPALMLAAVLGAHCIYLTVDPSAKNAFTAMPAIVLLASCASVMIRRKSGMAALFRLLLGSLLFFFLAHHLAEQRAFLSGFLPGPMLDLLPYLLTALWLVALVLLWRLTLNTVRERGQRSAGKVIVSAVFVTAAVVTSFHILADPERGQWFIDMRTPTAKIRQDIYTPLLSAARAFGETSYLLVDLDSSVKLPSVGLSVNGVDVKTVPVPWLQLRAASWGAEKTFLSQARSMGTGIQSFRQWWAIPLPTTLLRYDASNEFVLSSPEADPLYTLRVIGDYEFGRTAGREGLIFLPSLDFKMSIQKGFQTFAGADARVFESTRLLGKTSDSFRFDGKTWRGDDLSSDDGRQTGEFRMRLAIPLVDASGSTPPPLGYPFTAQDLPGSQPIVLFSDMPMQGVSAKDPWSMRVISSPLKIPPDLQAGTMFYFGCDLKDFESEGTAFASVEFSGEDRDGKTVTWASPWQPSCLHTERYWAPHSFLDVIPERILRLSNLRVSVTATPFHQDLLKLKPAEALARTVAMRNATLVLLPSFKLPPDKQCQWLLF